MTLPETKRVAYTASVAEMLAAAAAGAGAVPMALFERCVGQLGFASRATAWGRTFLHYMQASLTRARAADAATVTLSAAAALELTAFWTPLLVGTPESSAWTGRRTQHRGHGPTAATRDAFDVQTSDASGRGYAVAYNGATVSGAWPSELLAPTGHSGVLEATAVLLGLHHFAVAARGRRLLVRCDAAAVAFCLNTGTCRGQPDGLRTVIARIDAACIANDIDLRAVHVSGDSLRAEGIDGLSRGPAVAHDFLHFSAWALDGGGRPAAADLFAVRRCLQQPLAVPALRHVGGTHADEQLRAAAAGCHVWMCPPFNSDIIGAALTFGLYLLRDNPTTVVTAVLPAWDSRWWWLKYVASGPYTELHRFPSGRGAFARNGTLQVDGTGSVALAGFKFDVVVVRLAIPATALLLGKRVSWRDDQVPGC